MIWLLFKYKVLSDLDWDKVKYVGWPGQESCVFTDLLCVFIEDEFSGIGEVRISNILVFILIHNLIHKSAGGLELYPPFELHVNKNVGKINQIIRRACALKFISGFWLYRST